MKGYVDVFLLSIPKKNLPAYRKLAQAFSKLVKKHGALEYREWIGDDLKGPCCGFFPKLLKLKPSEAVISSVIEFRSKRHRDQVNKKVMNDPKMAALMPKDPLFDLKRMYYGGFATLIKM